MKTINLKLPDWLHKDLKRQAVEEDTDVTKLLVRVATDYLQRRKHET